MAVGGAAGDAYSLVKELLAGLVRHGARVRPMFHHGSLCLMAVRQSKIVSHSVSFCLTDRKSSESWGFG